MISRETIDRIFEAAHIEEVVDEFVQLKKAGSNFKGLSPWSNEKTPSFFVSPAKGIFKDFSSGKGGNVVSFLMELENMTYPEALRYLGNKYQIEVEETEMDPAKREEVSFRESLALVNKFVADYFTESLLKSDEGKSIGLSYFRERGFNDQTIEKFALGYAFDQSDALLKKATDEGFKLEHLLKLGLVKEGEYGKYDFFRGRVIFPIRNVSGRNIAFAGRTLKSDNKVKYLNSPESELYDKSNSLYGIYESKRAMIQADSCFLVEGYTDVISLHQSGIEYAVASSGTSLTAGQIKLIKRYTKNVSLLYDGDPAGIKASLRGIDLLLEEGMNVKVVLFPEGHDPDSYSQAVSSTELERYLVEEAMDFTDFMLNVLLEGVKDDPIKKAEATRRIVQSLALINDYIARSIYVERCSKKLDIPEQALLNELNAILRKKQLKSYNQDQKVVEMIGQQQPADRKENLETETRFTEKEIIRVLLNYGDMRFNVPYINDDEEIEYIEDVLVTEFILYDILNDEIELVSPHYQKVFKEIKANFEENYTQLPTENFTLDSDVDFTSDISELLTSKHLLSENWEAAHQIYTKKEEDDVEKLVFDPLRHIKLKKLNGMKAKIDSILKEETDYAEMAYLLNQVKKIIHLRAKIADTLGTTILY